jgi:hypothetical protein
MVPLMSESMDRQLGFSEYLKLRLHLLVCAWCARYIKQIKLIGWMAREMSDNTADNTPPSALNAAARERIAESLHQAK